MSANLGKRLKREILAKPKQAGALAALVVLAAWFWAPLVSKWFGGTAAMTTTAPSSTAAPASTPATTTTAPLAAPLAPVATATVATAGPAVAQPTWRQLAAAIDADPHMKPASELAIDRNPFAPLPTAVPAARTETAPPAAIAEIPSDPTPDELGLVLSSTVVGGRRQTAVVNGRVYRPGGEVRIDDEIAFVVTSVAPRRIVLSRNGQDYQLTIPQPE